MERVELLTIGDELLDGRLVDTNAGWMSSQLADAGLEVARHTSVGDRDHELVEVLRDLAARCDAVLVSGGLGPTSDDRTAACAARAFGLDVVRHPDAYAHTERFFISRGREMSESNAKQADLPSGCELLPNPHGTACGFRVDADGCRLYFMPGVPRELEAMVADHVLPDLCARIATDPPRIATLKIFGLGESDVAQRLEGDEPLVAPSGDLTVQYRATFPEIHVRLVLRGGYDDTLEGLRDEAARRIGRHVFAIGGARCDRSFADVVVTELEGARATVAIAEDLAAGGVGELLAEAADARHVVLGGELHPRSTGSAPALATDVRRRHGATFGIAVLPGPDPDGFRAAVSTEDGGQERAMRFPVEPQRLRRLAAYVALSLVRRELAVHAPG
jgi:competence/damage-inducible protein CinA-like protein